jgi:S-adenosylmethionine-diacylglycerol 3-amino-3-carboxypropyl transferase
VQSVADTAAHTARDSFLDARAALEAKTATRQNLRGAVEHTKLSSKRGLQDRLFTLVFGGLVYAQIWEDPVIDMEALDIRPDDRMVAIASGGCNALSYLTANPAAITAVDLNAHHVALNRLKVAGAQHFPDHATFRRFFGDADQFANTNAFTAHLKDHLDPVTGAYWAGRDWRGRRRISYFTNGFYRHGLLGFFIGAGHMLARLYRVRLDVMLAAKSLPEQKALFERYLAPIFDRKLVRWLAKSPAALFGLGIPPAQYAALLTSAKEGEGMEGVLRDRLRRLACDFPIQENYFAWQAFARSYGKTPEAPLPPYLQEASFRMVKDRAARITVRHVNFITHLEEQADASLDCYVLLDAQDWMSDDILTQLWTEITRTARPGARVIFRTAAEESLLPGRIPQEMLGRWSYDETRCKAWTDRDRSSIYGGFHLYTLDRPA